MPDKTAENPAQEAQVAHAATEQVERASLAMVEQEKQISQTVSGSEAESNSPEPEEVKTETAATESAKEEAPKDAKEKGPKIVRGPEPKIPRQQMTARGARGTTSRLPPKRRVRDSRTSDWEFADDSVPVVRQEQRHRTTDFSYAYFPKPCCFYSDNAQQAFERHFQRVDRSLLVITLVCAAIGSENLAHEQTEKAEALCREFQQVLMNAIANLKTLMEQNKIPADQQVPSYDHKRLYKPALHTPQSSQFVTVTELLDRLCARIEGAWINGILSASDRRKMLAAWNTEYVKFVNKLNRLRNDTMEIALNNGKRNVARQIESRVENDAINSEMKGEDQGKAKMDA